MPARTPQGWLLAAMLLGAGLLLASAGCNQPGLFQSSAAAKVPSPINLLLPQRIHIHPFTGMKTFDAAGGVKGIDVRVEALDAYGDATKAFGDFRFELYAFRPQNPDPKGRLIASWSEPLLDPKVNALHWWNVSRTYVFKLQCEQPIAIGQQYVLLATFSSPYSDRKFAQRVITAGQ
jgi:hypothetical protein